MSSIISEYSARGCQLTAGVQETFDHGPRLPPRFALVLMGGQCLLNNRRQPDTSKATLTTPPGVLEGVMVSAPERAALEMLYEVGTHESLEESRHVFEGLRNVRTDVVGTLLAACTSVKAVRLFLTWSRETGLVDVDALRDRFDLRVGSDARWVSRLGDGTLLL